MPSHCSISVPHNSQIAQTEPKCIPHLIPSNHSPTADANPRELWVRHTYFVDQENNTLRYCRPKPRRGGRRAKTCSLPRPPIPQRLQLLSTHFADRAFRRTDQPINRSTDQPSVVHFLAFRAPTHPKSATSSPPKSAAASSKICHLHADCGRPKSVASSSKIRCLW